MQAVYSTAENGGGSGANEERCCGTNHKYYSRIFTFIFFLWLSVHWQLWQVLTNFRLLTLPRFSGLFWPNRVFVSYLYYIPRVTFDPIEFSCFNSITFPARFPFFNPVNRVVLSLTLLRSSGPFWPNSVFVSSTLLRSSGLLTLRKI